MTRTVTAHTIASALGRVKALPQLVQHQHVLDACHATGHAWRDGVLNPLATISLFLIQTLHGNTACEHLRHLWPLRFTASAYCQARRRKAADHVPASAAHGHRLYVRRDRIRRPMARAKAPFFSTAPASPCRTRPNS